MYNQYLKVLPSKLGGQGIFTTLDIPADVPIMEVTGNVYAEHELPDPNHIALLQVGPNIFIGPSGSTDDYINHSCNPNCRMQVAGSRAIIHSMYFIKAGHELTFDYSTTSTDTLDKWKMDCHCGSPNCRKVISGFQYLPPELKKNYIERNMVPLFITNPIFTKRE